VAEYQVTIIPDEAHGEAGWVYESELPPEEGAAIKVVALLFCATITTRNTSS